MLENPSSDADLWHFSVPIQTLAGAAKSTVSRRGPHYHTAFVRCQINPRSIAKKRGAGCT